MKKFLSEETLWIIDNLVTGESKNNFKCIYKHISDSAFVVAFLKDQDGKYFITSQKNSNLNGLILKLERKEELKLLNLPTLHKNLLDFELKSKSEKVKRNIESFCNKIIQNSLMAQSC